MPCCTITMTPTAVIPTHSFLRTSMSSMQSHKTYAFLIDIGYRGCMFVPAGFFALMPAGLFVSFRFFLAMWSSPVDLILCEALALEQSAGCGTSTISAVDLEGLPSGKASGHSVHSV